MSEIKHKKLGLFDLFSIQTGYFRLDGGAMFGVVPKTLWSRFIEVDENNRIPMCMRSLLISSSATGRVYLIDTGIGNKYDEKFKKIYQIDDTTWNLHSSMKAAGFNPEDITDVIFTHLHFDHCGGAITKTDTGSLELAFPQANHWIHKNHWETATNPNAREKASFLPDNMGLLSKTDKLIRIEDGYEYEPGIGIITVNGHTVGQQLPTVTFEDTTLVYAADLLPTHVHVPLPWVMGYDMYPAETLLEKEAFLRSAHQHNWYIFLEHDTVESLIRIEKNDKHFSALTGYDLDTI